ncbi:MAG: DnaJ family domain-containing protein [Ktedonobacteraceae bacterium]
MSYTERPEPLHETQVGPATGSTDGVKAKRYRDGHHDEYVEELIREAIERGEFDNLLGAGRPLDLDENPYAGEKAFSYHLLKSSGFAPQEVELGKEIRVELERAQAKLTRLRHRSRMLRARRLPPYPSEKRAFNAAVRNAAATYEETLRELNRKILTLNLVAPLSMHQRMLDIEKLMREFRTSCPLFKDVDSR